MTKIEYNAAFRTDRAGREANQDNGFILTDIHNPENGVKAVNTDRTITPGEHGSLMVVADGMGGMNAGEKASELIKAGILQAFAKVPHSVPGDGDRMATFLVQAITSADESVKAYAREHRETRGMGSTIVALWIYGDMAVCAWVGDSRIYRFNPANGLVRLSHDHSYVQSLVDSGRLPAHMAHDHPDSNIITRSLGDNQQQANPQTQTYKVYDGDEFLLCSDGLCGLLTDEDIEKAMRAHAGSSKAILDALWAEGERRGWTDNATIEVACVSGDLPTPPASPDGYGTKPQPAFDLRQTTHGPTFSPVGTRHGASAHTLAQTTDMRANAQRATSVPPVEEPTPRRNSSLWLIIGGLAVVAIIVAGFILINKMNREAGQREEEIESRQYSDPDNYQGPTFQEKQQEESEPMPIEAPVHQAPQRPAPVRQQEETEQTDQADQAGQEPQEQAAPQPPVIGPEPPKEQ